MKFRIGMLAASVLFLATTAFADSAIDNLNQLLRGERSAVETYQQALKNVADVPGSSVLKVALKNHEKAVADISGEIVKRGGTPSTSSGAWGVWAETVTGSAKLLGDKTALKALKEGEEHGEKEYREILSEKSIDAGFKILVEKKYLPQQHEHVASLDQLINKL